MAGRVEGKVAFISGVARGQGRSHALRFAEEGADIIGVDICEPLETVPYKAATEEDLAETVRQVEALDRRIVATKADVRDFEATRKAVDDGVAQLGRLDIVSANAGIFTFGTPTHEVTPTEWNNVIDTNLTGVWHTIKAATPHMIDGGRGGSIVITSSTAGLKGTPNVGAYTAAKHAVVGLMRTLALELGPHNIRVNTIHPTGVETDMVLNEALYRLFMPDKEQPTEQDFREMFPSFHALPIALAEPIDISNAILFLASDEARYITGTELKVDAGFTTK